MYPRSCIGSYAHAHAYAYAYALSMEDKMAAGAFGRATDPLML